MIFAPKQKGEPMRAIDADALIDDCKKYLNELNPSRDGKECTRIHWLIGILSNAPTIKPKRNTGHWEITEAYPHNVYCSNCHRIFAQTHWTVWEDGSLSRNFCPNCGSYNGGGQDESD